MICPCLRGHECGRCSRSVGCVIRPEDTEDTRTTRPKPKLAENNRLPVLFMIFAIRVAPYSKILLLLGTYMYYPGAYRYVHYE